MTPLSLVTAPLERRPALRDLLSRLGRWWRTLLPRRRIDGRDLSRHMRRDIGLED